MDKIQAMAFGRSAIRIAEARRAVSTIRAGAGSTGPPLTADRELLIVEGPHPTKREPTSAGKFYALMGIAETLLGVDEQGHPAPGLATAWTVSDDNLEWRFDLRPGAHFHNGTRVSGRVGPSAWR